LPDSPDLEHAELGDLLGRVNLAISRGDPAEARRWADAARRSAPGSPLLSHLLSRLLLQCGRPDLAIRELDRLQDRPPSADVEALAVDALRLAGRLPEATVRLAQALKDFAVASGDPLAGVARRLILDPGAAAGAWVGVSPDLKLWGEMVDRSGEARLQARVDGAGTVHLSSRRAESHQDLVVFEASSPLAGVTGCVEVAVQDAQAIGSGLRLPIDFALDGRCAWANGQLQGWVSLGWSPNATPDVVLLDSLGHEARVATRPDPDHSGRSQIRLDPAGEGLGGPGIEVRVELPDGRFVPLPDSPVLTDLPAPPAGKPRRGRRREAGRAAKVEVVDIIIPAYRGCEETLACIRSVEATTGGGAEIVVVNDASPEPELALALVALAEAGSITLLVNETNLGFSGAVNRGFLLHPDRDVVILNSDAEVFPDWLARLRGIAASDASIGTVTPLSNTGSIASYPPGGGSDCTSARAAAISEAAGKVNRGALVEAPTGVGHCMFIKRACLDEIGPFDAEVFGRGYGEENDFCLRAGRAGWRHVIAGEVFVRHAGARSFGRDGAALLERNLKLLNRRWPGYDATVQDWISAKAIRPVLRRIDEAMILERQAPSALIVTLSLPGGAARFVAERTQTLVDYGFEVLVLEPARGAGEVRLKVVGGAGEAELVYDGRDEADALAALLRGMPIQTVELHHFMGLDESIVDLALGLGAPYDVFVHDYAWVCPRVTLIGGDLKYCGEPAIQDCETCLKTNGGRLEEGLTVRGLRERSDGWLRGAACVIAPSKDVARRLLQYFPGLKVDVRPWEAEAQASSAPSGRRAAPGRAVRAAVIGAIGDHKGFQVLLDCARDAAERELPLEFVVIGFTKDDETLLQTGKVFVTGEYEEGEVQELIEREAPDVSLFASVWPETWCFALTHALDAGLPAVTFDLGAIPERLGVSTAIFELLPLETDAASINDRLLQVAARSAAPNVLQSSPPPVTLDQGGPASSPRWTSNDQVQTAAAEPHLQHATKNPMPEAQSGLTATVEVLSLNKGLYMFSVKSASPRRVGEEGEVILPALHVGPAPGVAADQIEILTAQRANDTWLYERRDVLVVKVASTPTMVLVTSLRAAGMPPLELTLERLDVKREPPPLAGLLTHQAAPAAAAINGQPQHAPAAPAPAAYLDQDGRRMLRAQVMAHLRNRGDTTYVDTLWAGAPGESLPIEAFSIVPLEGVTPDQIEYKGLTSTGVETPWISGGAICGTRGMDVPLVGFAVRLKPGSSDRYECEYRGAFRSGRIIGPLANGAPCRAAASDDYLEGIQIAIVERAQGSEWSRLAASMAPEPSAVGPRQTGPRFSVFREDVQ
jgi:GT2 family glycosyltransferase/glycosyltransferase involved in cell wall biosynthesis